METYKGKINEFVDWTTGVNSITNQTISGVSSSNPISGQSIRELLQEHLKTPFVKYDDPKSGQYIFFSSEEAKNQWLVLTGATATEEQKELAKTLPITTMARPADTTISAIRVIDGREVGKDDQIDLGTSRYITFGDSASDEANIQYTVRMYKEQGGQSQETIDSFVVTFEITNSVGNVQRIVEEYDSNMVTTGSELKILSFNCYNYQTQRILPLYST